jgi:signal transduction histidine kinase
MGGKVDMSVLGTRTDLREGDAVLSGEGPTVSFSTVEPSVPDHEKSEYENKLHELRASLAAVAAAVRALEGESLPFGSDRRHRIERLLREELDRLQRLTAPSTDTGVVDPPEQLDLDEVMESLVIARGLAGHEVWWNRTGLRVQAHRDEVVEILNILLTNAARHASGSPAYIDVRREHDQVRIIVSDDGPGVPAELRTAIFDRGTRGPTGGDGIGLSVAKSLARKLGGSLDLRDAEPDRGAVFEMKLPWGLAGGLA